MYSTLLGQVSCMLAEGGKSMELVPNVSISEHITFRQAENPNPH